MSTYATVEQLRAYAEPSGAAIPSDDGEAEALIERAERDVDLVLGPHERDPDTGLKLDPEALEDHQREALARATSAQAEYRALLGEEAFVGIEDDVVAIAGIAFSGRSPSRVGAKVREELAGRGLVTRSGMVSPEGAPAD